MDLLIFKGDVVEEDLTFLWEVALHDSEGEDLDRGDRCSEEPTTDSSKAHQDRIVQDRQDRDSEDHHPTTRVGGQWDHRT